MEITNVHNAKTNLSKLLEKVSNGKKIIIAKSGKPVAILSSYSKSFHPRTPGALKGKIKMSATFDELPKSFTRYFGY